MHCYQLELLLALRKANARFTVSVPRNQAMWRAAAQIAEDAWSDATGMPGAQIAETTYQPAGWKHEPLRLIVRRVAFSAERVANGSVRARRRKTIPPAQLQLALDGQVETVYGYSFILTDHPAERDTAWVEHHHRDRAPIEERLKDAKLGQALRHLPCRNMSAERRGAVLGRCRRCVDVARRRRDRRATVGACPGSGEGACVSESSRDASGLGHAARGAVERR